LIIQAFIARPQQLRFGFAFASIAAFPEPLKPIMPDIFPAAMLAEKASSHFDVHQVLNIAREYRYHRALETKEIPWQG